MDVVKRGNWSRVEIVTKDRENPCIWPLVQAGVHFDEYSLTETLALLLRAENLVIGRSTFGIAIALLSPNLRKLYTFNQSSPLIGPHWNCEPTDEYFREICINWRYKEGDMATVLRSPFKGWTKVGDIDGEAP
jgi:hypothetical protein